MEDDVKEWMKKHLLPREVQELIDSGQSDERLRNAIFRAIHEKLAPSNTTMVGELVWHVAKPRGMVIARQLTTTTMASATVYWDKFREHDKKHQVLQKSKSKSKVELSCRFATNKEEIFHREESWNGQGESNIISESLTEIVLSRITRVLSRRLDCCRYRAFRR